MANEIDKKLTDPEKVFVSDLKSIAGETRRQAYRAADRILVVRNWLIGWRIVEQEQKGKKRAGYGKRVLELASQSLTEEYGKGFGLTSVKNMRSFYIKFRNLQIRQALLDEFNITQLPIRQPLPDESVIPFYPNVSWLHYERLMRVEDEVARMWYLKETARTQWDYRTLQRNISSQYYQRLLQTPEQLRHEVSNEMNRLTADFERDKLSYLKNPVIAEFLGLSQNPVYSESNLETAIIDHLQTFIMELGKGYAFVARQQHIKTDMGDFYIDLVFYNIILKSYLIIDLKTTQITHQDVGQMDMYIRMYDELKKEEGNNPTIGLLLCSDTSKDLARYSILKDSKQLYAAKYLTYLPSEEELSREIREQKEFFELQEGKRNIEKDSIEEK
ncbi:PDDEXK nuclease domain-containing protein [Phocaeicola coprocola]|uniref:PDDEXK nuclease domain-containing protein n=1 Tax=Phocaeicola coprocola TaxID=310298 RepID=UPI00266F6F8C|nr:PDDEXK nuclease domain-containing protein [Phocaeicola coprocola]